MFTHEGLLWQGLRPFRNEPSIRKLIRQIIIVSHGRRINYNRVGFCSRTRSPLKIGIISFKKSDILLNSKIILRSNNCSLSKVLFDNFTSLQRLLLRKTIYLQCCYTPVDLTEPQGHIY